MELQTKATDHMSDEQIIELYWQRDEKAIIETDIKYKRFLLSIAQNIVQDMCDSEECLNDTYIGVWNAIPPVRPTLLQAFLATIMRRTAINCYKARNRQKRVASELTVSLSEVEDFIAADDDMYSEIDTKELGRVISDFVRALSERRMYVFMSRYYVARPIKEIARLLECSESTINKEIAAIKSDLKKKLEKEGYLRSLIYLYAMLQNMICLVLSSLISCTIAIIIVSQFSNIEASITNSTTKLQFKSYVNIFHRSQRVTHAQRISKRISKE